MVKSPTWILIGSGSCDCTSGYGTRTEMGPYRVSKHFKCFEPGCTFSGIAMTSNTALDDQFYASQSFFTLQSKPLCLVPGPGVCKTVYTLHMTVVCRIRLVGSSIPTTYLLDQRLNKRCIAYWFRKPGRSEKSKMRIRHVI